jgi:hypothetical protein
MVNDSLAVVIMYDVGVAGLLAVAAMTLAVRPEPRLG